jgi:hypothetical protein
MGRQGEHRVTRETRIINIITTTKWWKRKEENISWRGGGVAPYYTH